MPYMYGILAVVGWVWTIIFGAWLIVRLTRGRVGSASAERLPARDDAMNNRSAEADPTD